jgi:hypothetical protein
VKNRLHLDLTPYGQHADVALLGTMKIDAGREGQP